MKTGKTIESGTLTIRQRILSSTFGLLLTAGVAAHATDAPFIFAADGYINLIRQFDLQGNEVAQITNLAFSFPTFLAADAATGTLITDINFVGDEGPDLVRIDLEGNILARNSSAAIFGMQGGGIIDAIPSTRGSFFVTSTLNIEIAEVDHELQLIRRFSSGAEVGGLRILAGALSPDGAKLFVADANGESGAGFIRIYDALTGDQLQVITNPALHFPFDLEFDNRGFLYVTDRGANIGDDQVLVFDQTFALMYQFALGLPDQIDFGRFTILPDGNLAVLETNFGPDTPIRILSPTGQLLSQFGSFGGYPLGVVVMSAPDDDDRDGVPNGQDQCPNTAANAAVGQNGCSIDQLVPCAGPATGGKWKNHGQYVVKVTLVAQSFHHRGLITIAERNAIVRAAVKSDCGKR